MAAAALFDSIESAAAVSLPAFPYNAFNNYAFNNNAFNNNAKTTP